MYWDKLQRRLVSRRRVLVGAGAGTLGVAAAGLVGCGDDGESNQTAPVTGAAKEPQRGGTLLSLLSSGPPHLDPVLNSSAGTVTAIMPVYSRLWKPVAKAGVDPWDWTLDPDIAVKLEQPDKTTYIYKLRQGMKWHDRPPLNGRTLVAEDVVYSIRRALDVPQSAIKGEFALIDSLRAIDPQTVELKAKEPFAPLNGKLGGKQMWITPREVVEQKGDVKEVAIGSGPFILDSYTPNVGLEYSRNPAYYGSPMPYADKLTQSIIADESAAESGFTTGKLDTYSVSDRRAFDRLARNMSDMQSVGTDSTGHYFYFRCDRPPANDVRVRQAFALTMDYEGLSKAFTSGEGRIDTVVPQAQKEWAVPPSQWGEGAKYHSKPDIAEAKKLLEAAGYGAGVEIEMYYSTSFARTRQTESFMQAMAAGAEKAGFRPKLRPEEYAVYAQRIQGTSEYSGMLHLPAAQYPDADDYVFTYLYPGARRFASFYKDPEMEALILKQRQEFDTETRKKIVIEIERRNLIQNYFMPTISFRAYNVWQKRLQNYSPRPDGPSWVAAAWIQA